jgi:hypothetical protein
VTPAAQLTRARRWPGVLAWGLWLLTMLALVAIPWLDRLLRRPAGPTCPSGTCALGLLW